jgi:hypothetical protein
MGHIKDKCWKLGNDGKAPFVANNYLEILVDDEDPTLEELNKLCAQSMMFSLDRKYLGNAYL